MDIGIPKESRPGEQRVALTPSGVKALVQRGHRVWVETGAGVAAGHADADYESAGATIAFGRAEPFARGQLIAAVSAPEPREYELLRGGQVVFAFWHLPAVRPDDVRALHGARGGGGGAGGDRGRRRPRARPDQHVGDRGRAGRDHRRRAAPQRFRRQGHPAGRRARSAAGALRGAGRGRAGPLGRTGGAGHGRAGDAARRAAWTACGRRRPSCRGPWPPCWPRAPNVEKALSFADMVLGAVAVHGQRAPVVVTREMLRLMRPRSGGARPVHRHGRLLRDLAAHARSPSPTYDVDGILHFCVPNLPAAAARSATLALTNALLPYLQYVGGRRLRLSALRTPRRPAPRRVPATRGRCSSGRWPAPSTWPRGACPTLGWRHELGGDLPAEGHDAPSEAVRCVRSGDSRLDPRRLQQPRGAGAGHGGARARAAGRRASSHLMTFGVRRLHRPALRASRSGTARSSPAPTCARRSTTGGPISCPSSSPRSRASSQSGGRRSTSRSSTSRRPTSTASARTAWASSARRRPPRAPRTVIALVNRQMPRSLGDSFIHVSRLTHVVEVDRPHPGAARGGRAWATVARAIGAHVAELIEDGATLQMGIGEIPDAVLLFLEGEARPRHPHRDVLRRHGGPLRVAAWSRARPRRCTAARSSPPSSSGSKKTFDFLDNNPSWSSTPATT